MRASGASYVIMTSSVSGGSVLPRTSRVDTLATVITFFSYTISEEHSDRHESIAGSFSTLWALLVLT